MKYIENLCIKCKVEGGLHPPIKQKWHKKTIYLVCFDQSLSECQLSLIELYYQEILQLNEWLRKTKNKRHSLLIKISGLTDFLGPLLVREKKL